MSFVYVSRSSRLDRSELLDAGRLRRPRTGWLASAIALMLTAALPWPAFAMSDPPTVGSQVSDFELPAPGQDVPIKLSEQLKKGPVVLVVLRGFPGYQCPLCSRQIGQYLRQAEAFAKAGAQVILVYPGPADELETRAAEFMKGTTLPEGFHFVIDPGYVFTEAYGLRWDAPMETAYPSTFVIDQESNVVFAKISRTHGDRTTPDQVLEAIPTR